ncbi:NHLP leader peptide family RiPP precursor [Nostoc punctiforme]|uniref:Nitrile hydratase-like protein n=1 Tax=Nostoc punctiforme (strain ATCC 29133 / PCC 73102) TaxID=63737 RepID=B2IYT1_NOSP7|nr:NHLP leader peptide family RiPP precursor [Nostoc punctiforme]ACC81664.1 nitrile hydratase-like protein [Nostoc punctiforme PCC 73102]
MSEQEQAQTRKNIEARIVAKAWKDEGYKQELLTNPKAIIEREFGVEFPAEVSVQVLEENSTSLYFVLPISPVAIAQELSEEQLEAIAGGYMTTLASANASAKINPILPIRHSLVKTLR